jgi:quercetin dioxygenase-like cupin family protein
MRRLWGGRQVEGGAQVIEEVFHSRGYVKKRWVQLKMAFRSRSMRMSVWIALALFPACTLAYAGSKGKAESAVFLEAKDVKWNDVPGFAGVHTATVEGDAAKGSHHSFMKFDAGFAAPLHHHTADHYVAVVAGTLVLTVDGKEHRLPAGSYFSFKNKGQHTTACAPGAECIIFADVRGKWDVVPEKK